MFRGISGDLGIPKMKFSRFHYDSLCLFRQSLHYLVLARKSPQKTIKKRKRRSQLEPEGPSAV